MRWTESEVQRLREQYPHTRTDVLAGHMGRTLKSVYQKAIEHFV